MKPIIKITKNALLSLLIGIAAFNFFYFLTEIRNGHMHFNRDRPDSYMSLLIEILESVEEGKPLYGMNLKEHLAEKVISLSEGDREYEILFLGNRYGSPEDWERDYPWVFEKYNLRFLSDEDLDSKDPFREPYNLIIIELVDCAWLTIGTFSISTTATCGTGYSFYIRNTWYGHVGRVIFEWIA